MNTVNHSATNRSATNRSATNRSANDARIARCYGSPQESVAAFRELNQAEYTALLRRVERAEGREGFWPPAPETGAFEEAGAFERVVDSVWRLVCRPEVRVVLIAMVILLLGMRLIDGATDLLFSRLTGGN